MKIVFATGGTGGHLFPALQLAEQLSSQGDQVFFIGSFKLKADLIIKKGFFVKEIDAIGWQGKNISGFFRFISCFIRSFFQSRAFLNKVKPDVVFGFGSYASSAVVIAAKFKKIKILLHEQNVVPGKATRFLAWMALKIAVSFPETGTYFNNKKIILSGCPHNALPGKFNKHSARDLLDLHREKYTIFVFGGSLGSQSLDSQFTQTAKILKEQMDFQVIHICNKENKSWVEDQYKKLRITHNVLDFSHDMNLLYAASDLVVARAGAVSVFEIAQYKLPAVFIPYPYAGNHQIKNAQALARWHVARILEQKDYQSERLKDLIIELKDDPYIHDKYADPGLQTVFGIDGIGNLVRLIQGAI